MAERIYIAIDLKSFYASVECIERGLNPLTANLVVADETRTEKTICLAVTPSLKALGISGRPRLFEVIQKIKEKNILGKGGHISYIVAPPRMSLYIDYSTRIYDVYLKYISPCDIHVYSIDEVFMDVTSYLSTYHMTACELAKVIIKDVLATTGITATAGVGTNLYLAKVAMDIVAKRMTPDKDGVRIAQLNEISYRETLWNHVPLTDFWRVGNGYARKLIEHGIYTMGDIARCSLGRDTSYYNEDLLYKLFGVNAELLIDHAWGYEPVTMEDIKGYKAQSSSLGSGQVLHCPYTSQKARIVVKEMTDALVLSLVSKGLVTKQIVLTVGYDKDSFTEESLREAYKGEVITDYYGRVIPKHAHGTVNFSIATSSTREIMSEVIRLYDTIVDERLLVRRINISACKVVEEKESESQKSFYQMDLFTDYKKLERERKKRDEELEKEKKIHVNGKLNPADFGN